MASSSSLDKKRKVTNRKKCKPDVIDDILCKNVGVIDDIRKGF